MKQLRELIERHPYPQREKDLLIRVMGKVIWSVSKERARFILETLYHSAQKIVIKIPIHASTPRKLCAWFRWWLNKLIARFKAQEPDPLDVEAYKTKPMLKDYPSIEAWKNALDDWCKTLEEKKAKAKILRQQQQKVKKPSLLDKVRKEFGDGEDANETKPRRKDYESAKAWKMALIDWYRDKLQQQSHEHEDRSGTGTKSAVSVCNIFSPHAVAENLLQKRRAASFIASN